MAHPSEDDRVGTRAVGHVRLKRGAVHDDAFDRVPQAIADDPSNFKASHGITVDEPVARGDGQ